MVEPYQIKRAVKSEVIKILKEHTRFLEVLFENMEDLSREDIKATSLFLNSRLLKQIRGIKVYE